MCSLTRNQVMVGGNGYIPLPRPLVRRLLVAQFVPIARVAGAAGVVDRVAVAGHFVFGQGAGEVAVGADLEAFEDGDGEGGGEVDDEEEEEGGGEGGEGWDAHFWFPSPSCFFSFKIVFLLRLVTVELSCRWFDDRSTTYVGFCDDTFLGIYVEVLRCPF